MSLASQIAVAAALAVRHQQRTGGGAAPSVLPPQWSVVHAPTLLPRPLHMLPPRVRCRPRTTPWTKRAEHTARTLTQPPPQAPGTSYLHEGAGAGASDGPSASSSRGASFAFSSSLSGGGAGAFSAFFSSLGGGAGALTVGGPSHDVFDDASTPGASGSMAWGQHKRQKRSRALLGDDGGASGGSGGGGAVGGAGAGAVAPPPSGGEAADEEEETLRDLEEYTCPCCGGPKHRGGVCRSSQVCLSVPIPRVVAAPAALREFSDLHFSPAAEAAAAAAQQGSLEWLAARIPYVTASDVGAICGVSPFSDARSVVAGKVSAYCGIAPPLPTDDMVYGSAMEPAVRIALEQMWGMRIVQQGLVTFGHGGYSSDGVVAALHHRRSPFDDGLEIKCRSPFSPSYVYAKRGDTISLPHLFQMLFGAEICARRGQPLGQMNYVVLIKGVIYVTQLPLAGPAGAPFRALGEQLFLAMERFSHEVLMPALVTCTAPARVRNVVITLPEGLEGALAAACAVTSATRVELVEPPLVLAIRVRRAAASALPDVSAADRFRVLGVPPSIVDEVGAWLAGLARGEDLASMASLRGGGGGGGGGGGDNFDADLLDFSRVLVLAHHRDMLAQELQVRGYSHALSFAAGAPFVARGSAALERCGAGKPEFAHLQLLAQERSTTPLTALIVEGRGRGGTSAELAQYESLARALAAAGDDDARRWLLSQPLSDDVYAHAQDAVRVGKGDIVYCVASCEKAVAYGRREPKVRTAATNAYALGGCDAVHAIDAAAFLRKVGVGPPQRAQRYASGTQPPHLLCAMPRWLNTGVGDLDGRNVLLAVEVTLSSPHAPVALRLPGVSQYGEPAEDRTAAMAASKRSTARAHLGAAAAGMDDRQLESAGAAITGACMGSC